VHLRGSTSYIFFLLAPQADGVVLIVKAGKMNREMVKKAMEQLHMGKANLVGLALSQVDVKREGYYKYYSTYHREST
jgi:Mrp family chromosome partitioning ATPase